LPKGEEKQSQTQFASDCNQKIKTRRGEEINPTSTGGSRDFDSPTKRGKGWGMKTRDSKGGNDGRKSSGSDSALKQSERGGLKISLSHGERGDKIWKAISS